MTNEEKLSAYLDGELSEADALAMEAAIAADPGLQEELEAIMMADAVAKEAFAEMVQEPVPAALAKAVKKAPMAGVANAPSAPSWWSTIAASLVFLLIGGVGGYFAGQSTGDVQVARGWLNDIADYHAVYASQGRHLVEVSADETDHIQTWLSNTVGADVRVPDLSGNGLTFEGARLLVAVGKPVAQLMFRDGDGKVVALCLIQSNAPQDGFAERSLNGFDMVTWGGTQANFVVVGDEGRGDLGEIAKSAATQV
ncbi:MAG: anti-sigma factor [Paracoccaceae bacterium]|nr:anti-sigma factor [Paracoccaceae bacterium]